jgi:hypothetical protein
MKEKSGKSKPTEIRVCNVVHQLKGPGFSLTVPAISATSTSPDGVEEEFIFEGNITHDEIASSVFRGFGLSAIPPFTIQKGPDKRVTWYIDKLEAFPTQMLLRR